ncbi:major facilitator superfamily domain-containing protein [Flagelloscypha sp. PMI_526]|nr:major facilitator superfamily domain-containing protein [Flagelloscypha sp. PMI_526]
MSSPQGSLSEKEVNRHIEDSSGSLKASGESQVHVSEADNARIARKIDFNILTLLAWVYWLQILDKQVLGYSALFDLKTATHLVGNQYSTIGSMNAIAQLAWQPFSSYLLVRVPPRYLMPVIVFCWGSSLCGMAAANNYAGLMATRFLLGLFEAACLPLFALITSIWYRRAEQPLRICIWYGTNGFGTILGGAMSFGLGHIKSNTVHSYQIIFIFTGLLTVITAPLIYWKLDNSPAGARFLNDEDRAKAVERVKLNQTGTKSHHDSYNWKQLWEALFEAKLWLFFAMTLLLNVGAAVTNIFGPLILTSLGFDKYEASLLNMPFGAVQILVIVAASYAAYRVDVKTWPLLVLVLPTVIGLVLLYVLKPVGKQAGVMLFGYYLLACLYGGNPLIVSWIAANTAGSTKKAVTLSAYNAAVAAGNIIGPLLFNDKDKPRYLPGLRACLGIFCALFVTIILQYLNLHWLNHKKRQHRVANGKSADVVDKSMSHHFQATGDEAANDIPEDLSDKENDEFVYVY